MFQGDLGLIGPVGLTGQEGRKVRLTVPLKLLNILSPNSLQKNENQCCFFNKLDPDLQTMNSEALEKFGKAQ